MSHNELYLFFEAACDITTRAVYPTRYLPAPLTPKPYMRIFDTSLFAGTSLSRLDSSSKLVVGLAEKNLEALIKFSNNYSESC